ncbi:Clp protease N-terminal domain-containing protein [Nonomuraea jiangxiensis]|uniref:ATP-dependent Clp protease ATP-binding subunit ClpC n=1 Tax=Nonomuraea jiangxiensis TaxID=633440 RepID=A0A1G8CT92_9ACTN|nr:Clp protease N-terminal domain-containing protein [Nonomuraea jiangxiensis]SDH48696.1 ATP-dependent Clp protease ATP-binding subunit ClpC [Nonomuraea jiangxiensis]
MPKINVYLPDELAEAVKQAGVPVSAVCQRALEQAVRRVTAIRETVLADVDFDRPTGALTHLTARTRTVLKLAADQARTEGATTIGTTHLLGGMLTEGTNLALHVLRAMEITPEQVKRDLSRQSTPNDADTATQHSTPGSFGSTAANALEFAVTEATSLGHNYVGCEHLLLGLVAEPDGTAGQVLRGLGAEPRLTRRAVSAALAGYVHLRAQAQQGDAAPQPSSGAPTPQQTAMLAAAIRGELQPLVQRLERLEAHVGLRE